MSASPKNCVVLGGAGDVGEGIVRQLRYMGHTVCVPSRSATKLLDLDKATTGKGDLVPIVGQIGDRFDIVRVVLRIQQELKHIDLVVAAIGGWWSGPKLVELAIDDWDAIIQSSLTAHFIAARAFLNSMLRAQSGQYLFINGAGALSPVVHSGPVSIAAAAQEMLKSALAKELEDQSINIASLLLMTPIRTRSRKDGDPGWLTADDVGKYVRYLADYPPRHGETVELRSAQTVAAALSSSN